VSKDDYFGIFWDFDPMLIKSREFILISLAFSLDFDPRQILKLLVFSRFKKICTR